jgi:hypothetical protein
LTKKIDLSAFFYETLQKKIRQIVAGLLQATLQMDENWTLM